MMHISWSSLSRKRKVVVFLIGVQVSVSLSLVAFDAFLFYLTNFTSTGSYSVLLMLVLAGPINLITVSSIPIFAAISTILAVGLAGLAIRWSSYILTACFLAVWYISGASVLLFVT